MPTKTESQKKALGLPELIAVALGGMVGGGIFSILGISVQYIGNATPVAILMGGILAMFAAYSYVKLALYFKDEGATYSFFKKSFPGSPFASSVIGWMVVFGYISTLALYAFTFSSYLGSILPFTASKTERDILAGTVLLIFTTINLISVKGMGRIEDIMVYTKVIILLVISALLAANGKLSNMLPIADTDSDWLSIFIIAAVTFVAFEGFQLVINAYNEMDAPQKNIPRAIYIAILIATLLYLGIAFGALATIPKELIIQNKEFALAAGAKDILGKSGLFIMVAGALLATSSAISGTIFGASRLMSAIAKDGYLPAVLAKRKNGGIPRQAIITMSIFSFILILSGGLQTILEFGSITFIIVSFLMAFANFKRRDLTKTHILPAWMAMIFLFSGGILIFYFEYSHAPEQLIFIGGIYIILTISSLLYARYKRNIDKSHLSD